MPKPQLVRNDDADAWGLYYPDRNVIEAAIDDEINEIPCDHLGANWYRAEEQDLRKKIEADVEALRAGIEDMRERELTDEQERELRRLEMKLRSHETVVNIAREVQDADN